MTELSQQQEHFTKVKQTSNYHKYLCKTCGRLLSNKENFESHSRIHEGKKSFKCGFLNCKKTFATEKRRLMHCKTHIKDTFYKCEICQKEFKQKGNLKTHSRIHTGEKPFQCRFCMRSFRAMGQVLDHENSHLGNRCQECGKRFTRGYTLKNHYRVHTNEKPYKCLIEGCSQYFSLRSNRKRHFMRHRAKLIHSTEIEEKKNQNDILKSNTEISPDISNSNPQAESKCLAVKTF